MEFPFDEEKFRKLIDSTWLERKLGYLGNQNRDRLTTKESIIKEYERFKKEQFFFKISEEYKTLFLELGIKDVESFLFPNPLHDQTFFEFELYFATEYISEGIYVINNEELLKLTDRFDHDSLINYIKTMEVSIEYLLRVTMDMNNYALDEYKEGYVPEFNSLALLKLEDLKNGS